MANLCRTPVSTRRACGLCSADRRLRHNRRPGEVRGPWAPVGERPSGVADARVLLRTVRAALTRPALSRAPALPCAAASARVLRGGAAAPVHGPASPEVAVAGPVRCRPRAPVICRPRVPARPRPSSAAALPPRATGPLPRKLRSPCPSGAVPAPPLSAVPASPRARARPVRRRAAPCPRARCPGPAGCWARPPAVPAPRPVRRRAAPCPRARFPGPAGCCARPRPPAAPAPRPPRRRAATTSCGYGGTKWAPRGTSAGPGHRQRARRSGGLLSGHPHQITPNRSL